MARSAGNTRERLIQTATDLIWSHSYGSVSVDKICKAAGVRKGSFYHFFASKSELAVAAMEDCFAKMMPVYNEMFSPAVPPLQRFERMVDFKIQGQKDSALEHGHVCGCPFATVGSELAAHEESIRAKIEEIGKLSLSYYENALRDLAAAGLIDGAMDIRAKAVEINAYILGQMLMARIHNTTDFLEKSLKSGLWSLIGVREKPVS